MRMGGPPIFTHMEEREALLLLGGNLGDPRATLTRAAMLIGARAGTVVAQSRDHWTEPWGFNAEQLFLNRALIVRTSLSPEALLRALLEIERELGRVRVDKGGYTSRTIDIDLLLQGAETFATPALTLPHPRMHQRWFALAPSADVAPGWMHPLLGHSILDLLNDLRPQR